MSLLSEDQPENKDDNTESSESGVFAPDPAADLGTSPIAVITPDLANSDEPHVVGDAENLDSLDPDYVGPRKLVAVEQTIAQEADPQRRRPGGNHNTYLDREQRVRAEIIRAKVEGREPDLDNPPPSAGTPPKPTEVLADQFPASHKIPVNLVTEQSVGTDDPTTLRPEDHEDWDRNNNGVPDSEETDE